MNYPEFEFPQDPRPDVELQDYNPVIFPIKAFREHYFVIIESMESISRPLNKSISNIILKKRIAHSKDFVAGKYFGIYGELTTPAEYNRELCASLYLFKRRTRKDISSHLKDTNVEKTIIAPKLTINAIFDERYENTNELNSELVTKMAKAAVYINKYIIYPELFPEHFRNITILN